MAHVKLSPSILTADFGRLADEVRAAEAGGADSIHLDVMDGSFVPNISFGMSIVVAVRQATTLPVDVHLMVQEPGRYVAEFAAAGADRLTVHWEACTHLNRTLQQILDLGKRASVALNPATPVEMVREILPMVDLVLVMTVNPGFGGQRFLATSLNKIQRLAALQAEINPTCELQADGGIGVDNLAAVVAAGANNIVVGSAVYNKRQSVAESLAALRSQINK